MLLHLPVGAQDKKTCAVSGYIYDESSKETLIGATVLEPDLQKGTVSNNYGFYSISLPPGEVSLSASYVGYNTGELRFHLSKDTVIDWRLALSTTLQEVVVEARRGALSNVENTRLGAVSLSPSLVKSVPAILGEVDLVKVLQQMPGVSAGTEGFSGLYVRGGNKDENLYLIDGNPVYDVNHLFGFFSTFNADAIKSAEFYKSSFPARFGGRLSSVVDVRTKDGNMQDYHGLFTIGLISSKAQLEGPVIKDKASFNIAFRRTYLDVLATPLMWIVNSQSDTEKNKLGYYFYDLNAKLNYKFSNRSRMYFNWYSGKDAFDVRQEWTYNNSHDNSSSFSENGVKWNWGNKLASVNWNYIFHSKLFGNMSAIYSRYDSRIRLFEQWEGKSNSAATAEQSSMNMYYDSGIEDVGYRMDFDYTPQPGHAVKFGSNYLFHTFSPEENGTASSYNRGGIMNGDTTNFPNGKIRAHEWAAYAEDDITLGSRLKANLGLNLSLFHVEGKPYARLQPRVSARYLINGSLSLKASYAMMNQYVHLLSSSAISLPTDLWVPVTKNIRPMLSNQYSAAVFYNLKKEYDFSLEAYYKTMDNVIEYRDGASMFASSANWQERVAMGKGRSYGIELLAQKSAGKLTGWIGYGLSWTDRQFPGGEINGGRRFYAKYDNRHKINAVASYKLSDKVDVNASWTYYSGNWMTVAKEHYETAPQIPGNSSGNMGFGTNETPYYDARNNYRMSDYHRLDLGFNSYRPKKNGRMGIWNLSIYNAYCHLNPMLAYPSSQITTGAQGNTQRKALMTEYSLFPIIPSFSYTYKF
ncbi:TonB-dependent receptor [Bacteroidia bacterium]|nr:TonB-dependent receptor [Bacteroidia bacterium]